MGDATFCVCFPWLAGMTAICKAWKPFQLIASVRLVIIHQQHSTRTISQQRLSQPQNANHDTALVKAAAMQSGGTADLLFSKPLYFDDPTLARVIYCSRSKPRSITGAIRSAMSNFDPEPLPHPHHLSFDPIYTVHRAQIRISEHSLSPPHQHVINSRASISIQNWENYERKPTLLRRHLYQAFRP